MAATLGLVLAVALATPLPASALRSVDYPTWDDVQTARGTQATAAAAVEQIEGLVLQLSREAEALGKIAQQRAEAARIAADALADAGTARDRLRGRADAAENRADASQVLADQVIVRLARQGGGSLTAELLAGDARDADALLYRLGVLDRLGSTSAETLERARFDRSAADALADQADDAEREYAARQRAAQAAADAAQSAAGAAVDRVTEQQERSDVLVAQLATLKGTTEATERAYIEGLIASQAPPAPTTPTTPTNPTTPTTPTNPTTPVTPTNPTTPVTPVTPEPPAEPAPTPTPTPAPPVASAAASAIAYARAQLGDPYVFAGMGPDGWDCSGLTKASYASAGVYIGTHSATNQYNTLAARGRLVPVSALEPGDLLFYASGGGIYHVAMYTGGGRMIEAPYAPLAVREVPVRYGDLLPNAGRPTG